MNSLLRAVLGRKDVIQQTIKVISIARSVIGLGIAAGISVLFTREAVNSFKHRK